MSCFSIEPIKAFNKPSKKKKGKIFHSIIYNINGKQNRLPRKLKKKLLKQYLRPYKISSPHVTNYKIDCENMEKDHIKVSEIVTKKLIDLFSNRDLGIRLTTEKIEKLNNRNSPPL